METLSWIVSLWFGMTNITGPIHSWLVEKVGYRWLLFSSCILSCFAMMMASISNTIWQLALTQGFLSGLGSSLAWFCCISAPQQHFKKRRGLAVGITYAGSGFGSVILNFIVKGVIQSAGTRWALRVVGFIQLVLLAITAITVKPFDDGLPKKQINLLDFSCFKNKRFWLLMVLHILVNFAYYIPSTFIPAFARYLGLGAWTGTYISMILSAVVFFGKICNGFISDYVGRFNMCVVTSFMAAIMCLAVWSTATTAGAVWAFAAVYGYFASGYIAMITAVISQVVGADQVENATGYTFFGWLFGGLFSAPLTSLIINRTSEPDYQGAAFFAGALFAVSCLVAITLRIMQGGFSLKKL
ncbi:major facilitator superfamily domain-containing protein [Cunninghamella echinulata]|nr:major facilitator superfamily domain-containing protein [Cunninghamella echinulata]